MRARFTTYAVPGWGVGELWTRDEVVLAHEFRFKPVSDTFSTGVDEEARAGTAGEEASTPPRGDHQARSPCGTNDTLSARLALDETRCLTPSLLVGRFAAFFAGADVDFRDVPIDLEWVTPFQRAVADALREVPRGAVVSYGELAALAGYPGAARAAGSFCARNRFMLIVPCHRVVGASGLGGYGSAGPETKRRLLALEGVAA